MSALSRALAWIGLVALGGCGDGGEPLGAARVMVAALPAVTMERSDAEFMQRLDAALKRDPFRAQAAQLEVAPGAIAGFSLRQLTPRGVIADRHGRFALVETSEGRVVRVAIGELIGEERARVVDFDAMGLTIELPLASLDDQLEPGPRLLRLSGAEPEQ